MKQKICLSSAVLLASTACYAQTSPVPIIQAPSPSIPLQLNGATLDDALVALGQAAHVNFLSDATHFAKDAPPITVNSIEPLEQHLAELDAQADSSHKLTWLLEGQTLLLWTSPDMHLLVQQALAGQTIKLAQPDTSANNASTAQGLLYKELADFFREQRGWDESKPESVREIKISDLPPSLRSEVIAASQRNLFRTGSVMIWQQWFNDEFWKNAQLKVVEEDNGIRNGPKIPVLVVGESIKTKAFSGGSMISLGTLKGNNKG